MSSPFSPAPSFATCKAYAEDIDTNPTADALQQHIEETAAIYAEAQEQAKAANEAVAENAARIDELIRQIPLQQERSAAAARELYKVQRQRVGMLEMLLGADSFFDFLANLEYIDRITSANVEEIERLRNMEEELEAQQVELKQAKANADARENEAKAALEEAQAARTEAQRRAQESARQAEEARSAAQAAGLVDAGEGGESSAAPSDVTGSSSDSEGDGAASGAATTTTPTEGATIVEDGANWASEEDAFIGEWAGRIDAYLTGSPMAGQGSTFARAAWNYGVDPRWSPAIACLESSKGLYCFLPHNAWGWGSASWGSWEEAIDAHVRGLARGYGYTISMDAARKYCPPNADYWYSFVCSQMNLI